MELKRYQLAHSMVGCAEHCKNRIGQVHRGVAWGWSGHSGGHSPGGKNALREVDRWRSKGKRRGEAS